MIAATGRARACANIVLAQALAREGARDAALAALDAGAPDLPELAIHLAAARTRLGARAGPTRPEALPTPTTPDAAAEAVTLLLKRARPRAAAALATAFPRGEAVHEPLELATITALVRAERVDDALAHVSALPPSDALRRIQAWALSKGARHREARALYASLASTTADAALRAEAAFYAAFASYEASELDDAHAGFAAAVDVTRGTSFEASTRWYLALCDLLRGRWADAAATLEALVAAHPSDREVLKHRYWLARARLATLAPDATKRGRQELEAIAAQDALDFYALLARQRLGRAAIRGTSIARDAVAARARSDDAGTQARLLWQLGLDDEARAAARALGGDLADIGVQHQVDDAHHGWRRGARHLPMPRAASGALVPDPGWRVSFAAPWSGIVDAAAARHAVPASFVYAIMRTESGFDPGAVSPAGARGALQLMPAVARGACGLAKRTAADADRIFEPEVAIDLGAALLGQHVRELGSTLLAAAAYNGGAHHVVRWLELHRALETELFIERIPFKETRDYVKRVLAAEATYRALDGGTLSLELPATLPQPPPSFTEFPSTD